MDSFRKIIRFSLIYFIYYTTILGVVTFRCVKEIYRLLFENASVNLVPLRVLEDQTLRIKFNKALVQNISLHQRVIKIEHRILSLENQSLRAAPSNSTSSDIQAITTSDETLGQTVPVME